MKLDLKEWISKIVGIIKGDNGAWGNVNQNYVIVSKRSGVVTVYGESNGTVTLSGGAWNNIGTLSNGYRPSANFNFLAFDRNHLQPLWGQVTTAGVVRIYCDSNQTCNYWIYSTSFPVVGGYCVTQLLQCFQPFPKLEVA